MKKPLITAILSLPLIALAGPVASTNLLNNGDFDSDAQAVGSFSINTNLTGWTGGTYGIELRDAVAGSAYSGSNFVELDTTANSSMSQTFATNVGET